MATDTRIPALLSDDARDGTPERPDELSRWTFIGHLAGLLDNVRAQSESSVMALIGDWGSGKTTVLELLTRRLDSATWLVGTFNPWNYPDTAALQRGFFAELAATLPEDARPGNARAKIGALARTLSPIGALGSIVGVNAEGTLRLAADLIAGDTSTTAAKDAADRALRATRRPILMIIDDLDRLTPDELLEVLKLVRLVGRLPHVYYLLSYDEQTLLDVLQRTPFAGSNQDRARAYLEKIVQVRLDMPALRDTQRSELLNRGLQAILTTCDVMLTDTDRRRLTWIYDAVLDHRLTTPRAINRFLGQVQAFYPPLHDEVDFVDFFLVTWLRTQEPGIYTMLQHHRDDLLAQSLSTWAFASRNAKDADARRATWQGHLDSALVSAPHQPGVIRVLSDLFPEIKAAFTDANHYVTAIARSS
jgi:predicted KAP-like P-loop ATPase